MESENETSVTEFILLGLSVDPDIQSVLFGLLLTMYLVSILGNLLIILAFSTDSHLHTPMYFFLFSLSLNDICSTSTVVPKMLVNIQIKSKAITYASCLAQVCFFFMFVCMENLLLTVMAYDRYVAICHPLHYTVIMNPRLCVLLVLICLLITTVDALSHTMMLLRLSFCKHLEIPHFFCEISEILKLACSDSLVNNILLYLVTILLGIGPVSGIIFSYTRIVSSILRIPSTGGKYKAFSTCGSDLSLVSLFYGTGIGVYLSSAVTDSPKEIEVASLMYTVVTPMLNPFIYSLRNKDMKDALRKLTEGIFFCSMTLSSVLGVGLWNNSKRIKCEPVPPTSAPEQDRARKDLPTPPQPRKAQGSSADLHRSLATQRSVPLMPAGVQPASSQASQPCSECRRSPGQSMGSYIRVSPGPGSSQSRDLPLRTAGVRPASSQPSRPQP